MSLTRKSFGSMLFRAIVDGLIGVGCFVLAWYIRSKTTFGISDTLVNFSVIRNFWQFLPLVFITQPVLFHCFGNYRRSIRQNFSYVLFNLIAVVVTELAVIVVFAYFFGQNIWRVEDALAFRSIILLYGLLNGVLLYLWALVFDILKRPGKRQRVLIIGINDTTKELINEIERDKFLSMDLIGLVSFKRSKQKKFKGYPVLGSIKDVPRLIQEKLIDDVILSPIIGWQDEFVDAISSPSETSARLLVVPSSYEMLLGELKGMRIRDIPLMEAFRQVEGPLDRVISRLVNFFGALICIIISSWVMLIVALLVLFSSKGPIFYTQVRVGKNMRRFKILKFRTMIVDAEKKTGAVLSSKDDPRITPIGKFLRKTRLDELPQLFNILLGQMNFIGPRPERPEFVDKYIKKVHGYSMRYLIKPGITGLAQTHGEYHTSQENRLKFDIAYIFNRSLWMDVLIIFETIKTVLTARGV